MSNEKGKSIFPESNFFQTKATQNLRSTNSTSVKHPITNDYSDIFMNSDANPINFIDSGKFRFDQDSNYLLNDYLDFDMEDNKFPEETNQLNFKKMNFSMEEFEASQKMPEKKQKVEINEKSRILSPVIDLAAYDLKSGSDSSEEFEDSSIAEKSSNKSDNFEFPKLIQQNQSVNFSVPKKIEETAKKSVSSENEIEAKRSLSEVEFSNESEKSEHVKIKPEKKEELEYISNSFKVDQCPRIVPVKNSAHVIPKTVFVSYQQPPLLKTLIVPSISSHDQFLDTPAIQPLLSNYQTKEETLLEEIEISSHSQSDHSKSEEIRATKAVFTEATFGNLANPNKCTSELNVMAEFKQKELLLEEEKLKNEVYSLDKKLISLQRSIFQMNIKHNDLLVILSDAYYSGDQRKFSEPLLSYFSNKQESETDKDLPSFFFDPSLIEPTSPQVQHSLIKPRTGVRPVFNTNESNRVDSSLAVNVLIADQVKKQVSEGWREQFGGSDNSENEDFEEQNNQLKIPVKVSEKNAKEQFLWINKSGFQDKEIEFTKLNQVEFAENHNNYQTFALKISKFQTLGGLKKNETENGLEDLNLKHFKEQISHKVEKKGNLVNSIEEKSKSKKGMRIIEKREDFPNEFLYESENYEESIVQQKNSNFEENSRKNVHRNSQKDFDNAQIKNEFFVKSNKKELCVRIPEKSSNGWFIRIKNRAQG